MNHASVPPTHSVVGPFDFVAIGAFIATFFDLLPKATALLIFVYYTLMIVKMWREMRAKRLGLRRRKTDA